MTLQQTLRNAHKAAQTLRRISRFIHLHQRSVALMQDGQEEYPNVASNLAEIDLITSEVGISTIKWLQTEFSQLNTFRKTILDYADSLLQTGIMQQNQGSILNGFLIHQNLQILPETIYSLLNSWIETIHIKAAETFNASILNSELKVSKQGSNVTQWANILWKRTEGLADVIYTMASYVHLLEQVLARKRESLSSESNLEQVIAVYTY